MIMTVESIIDDKLKYIKQFVAIYEIDFDIDTFNKYISSDTNYYLVKCSSVSIAFEKNDFGFRLIANYRYIKEVKIGEYIKSTKNVTLYSFLIRSVKKLDENEVYKIREDFIRFTLFVDQVKNLKSFLKIESALKDIPSSARNISLKTIKFTS